MQVWIRGREGGAAAAYRSPDNNIQECDNIRESGQSNLREQESLDRQKVAHLETKVTAKSITTMNSLKNSVLDAEKA